METVKSQISSEEGNCTTLKIFKLREHILHQAPGHVIIVVASLQKSKPVTGTLKRNEIRYFVCLFCALKILFVGVHE